MEKLRKITVQVPKTILNGAQAYTGKNITQTVRAALDQLLSDAENAPPKMRERTD